MTASELTVLRRALMTRLEAIVRSVPRPEASDVSQLNADEPDPEDDAEHALLDELDGIMGQLNDREAHLAEEMVAALERMRTGEYGLCVDCKQEIPFARLQAVPWTLRCALDQNLADGNAHAPTL
jgi:RNA polymerase-binding transcription factor DksA